MASPVVTIAGAPAPSCAAAGAAAASMAATARPESAHLTADWCLVVMVILIETTIISIVSGLCGHSKASPFWI
jgi:hypothetical protein